MSKRRNWFDFILVVLLLILAFSYSFSGEYAAATFHLVVALWIRVENLNG